VSNPKHCPGDPDLERFILGRSSEGDRAGIAVHVEQCPRCLAALEAFNAKDPLVDALRRGRSGSSGADRVAVDRLVERLRAPVSAALTSSSPPGNAARPVISPGAG
jgi:anti-sigma factor RsiW